MPVSNFQTLIKSCSIEPEMVQVQFMNLQFNRWLCGWMGKVAGILIGGVGVVSSIPSGGNFIFADFETPWCQFCTKMPEMSDLCYLGKTRVYIIERSVCVLNFFFRIYFLKDHHRKVLLEVTEMFSNSHSVFTELREWCVHKHRKVYVWFYQNLPFLVFNCLFPKWRVSVWVKKG